MRNRIAFFILTLFILFVSGCSAAPPADTSNQSVQLPHLEQIRKYIPDIEQYDCSYLGQINVNDRFDQLNAYDGFIAPNMYEKIISDYRCSAFKSFISHVIPVGYLTTDSITFKELQLLEHGFYNIYFCSLKSNEISCSEDNSVIIYVEQNSDPLHFFIWKATVVRSVSNTGLFDTKSENVSIESMEIGGHTGDDERLVN